MGTSIKFLSRQGIRSISSRSFISRFFKPWWISQRCFRIHWGWRIHAQSSFQCGWDRALVEINALQVAPSSWGDTRNIFQTCLCHISGNIAKVQGCITSG